MWIASMMHFFKTAAQFPHEMTEITFKKMTIDLHNCRKGEA